MNNEELHALATDFRRLRSEILDRSNEIMSLFETALKRSAVVQTSNEQFTYLEYGIRITEGDYVLTADRSQPASEIALFSETEKRQTARSVGVSQAADLNDRGAPANVSRSNSNKMWEPLKRSLTATQKVFDRKMSTLTRKKTAASGTRDPEHINLKQPEIMESALSSAQANQRFQVPELPKHLFVNAIGAGLKPQLSIVTEGNSSLNSCSSTNHFIAPISLDRLQGPHFTEKLFHGSTDSSTDFVRNRNDSLVGHESVRDFTASHPSSPNIVPISIAIQFNDLIVQRFINSNMSSLAANASQDSVADSIAVTNSLLSTPKSDVRRQSSFRRSLSRKRVPSIAYQTPTHSIHKRGSDDTQATEHRFSLVPSGIQSKSPSHKAEDPKIQTPNFFAYLFLLPAYDYKGRRVSVESLAAFGKITAVFHVNGIHPRSLFSNIWDLCLGVVMSALMWLIPFVAAYNPTYQICDINILAITISVIFLCDSTVSLITPQLVSGDHSLDLTEYEKARPTLPVWLSHWIRKNCFINILTVIPFTIFFRSEMNCEFILFIALIRCLKLWRHFFQCPTMTYAVWCLDNVAGTSVSRTIPLTCGIFWFIHCNSCTIFWMGRMSGFVGWDAMWPLVHTATLFETYVWTYYKAVGNMFPTSFNPWTATEQLASLLYIILAAVVYAIFLGAISSAVMEMNPSGRLFDQKVGELRDYIRSKDLSKETEARLLTYYETRYRGKYFEEDALLSELNDSLKAEILLQNTRKLIVNVPFLKRTAGDGRDELFMGRIAAALRSINFIPGDFVTKQGDSGSDMYFILTGKAEVYVNERHAVTLGAGAYFGEVGLITKTLRTATVQAVLPSLMYRLTYLDFHRILDDFTDMRIRMDMLAEEREKVIKLEEMKIT
ncbi:hypothetical protein BJ741DRAFT_613733 [Chytriomyces cf. hyalinus JEL632]|nr:hypothetical protein BJ741DRAFT_613733 [Chytriomyces cf. hyalinus JEL632]